LPALAHGLTAPHGIGFGGVFPYMGLAIHRMRHSSAHAAM
jgi:hypothetical protein